MLSFLDMTCLLEESSLRLRSGLIQKAEECEHILETVIAALFF